MSAELPEGCADWDEAMWLAFRFGWRSCAMMARQNYESTRDGTPGVGFASKKEAVSVMETLLSILEEKESPERFIKSVQKSGDEEE